MVTTRKQATKKKAGVRTASARREATSAEDAVAAEILAAYPEGPCTWNRLSKLLERGGRARDGSRPRVKPTLLARFVGRCAVTHLPEGPSLAAAPLGPFLSTGDATTVLSVGNGDEWVCGTHGDDPLCYYVDHEDLFEEANGVPLSQLLAGYLLMQEILAGELDHPELEARFERLVPGGRGFPSLPL